MDWLESLAKESPTGGNTPATRKGQCQLKGFMAGSIKTRATRTGAGENVAKSINTIFQPAVADRTEIPPHVAGGNIGLHVAWPFGLIVAGFIGEKHKIYSRCQFDATFLTEREIFDVNR